jgi:hypothetical protein
MIVVTSSANAGCSKNISKANSRALETCRYWLPITFTFCMCHKGNSCTKFELFVNGFHCHSRDCSKYIGNWKWNLWVHSWGWIIVEANVDNNSSYCLILQGQLLHNTSISCLIAFQRHLTKRGRKHIQLLFCILTIMLEWHSCQQEHAGSQANSRHLPSGELERGLQPTEKLSLVFFICPTSDFSSDILQTFFLKTNFELFCLKTFCSINLQTKFQTLRWQACFNFRLNFRLFCFKPLQTK